MMSVQASVGTTFLLQHRQQINHHHPLQPSTTSRWNTSNIWSIAAFFYYKNIFLLVIISCVYLWLYRAYLPQPEIPALCSGALPLCPHTFLCPDNKPAGLQRERQLNKVQLSKTRERHTSTFRCGLSRGIDVTKCQWRGCPEAKRGGLIQNRAGCWVRRPLSVSRCNCWD